MKIPKKNNLIQVVTLGCAKNLVDSEFLLGKLVSAGYQVVHDQDHPEAEIAIINTCGFIGDAKEESIEMILQFLQAKKEGRFKKVFVMGCLSQRYRNDLQLELPEVDGFFGVNEQLKILHTLRPDLKKELTGERLLTTPKHYAYLKISEGCGRNCSFCAIPSIRGKQVSVPIEILLKETRQLAALGVKEINVIAQDTTQYGIDLYHSKKLPELLDGLSLVDGIEWIRLHYAYPKGFPTRVLQVMKENPKVCRYLDIPLQHIDENILRSMKRGISRENTILLLDKMRKALPGLEIRTTLIVGYPGEGDKEFRDLYDFVRQQRFNRLGVFTYSPEEGTSAYKLGDPIPEKVKNERQQAIMELQMAISEELNQAKTGQMLKVVIDRKEGESYIGRTEFDSPEVDNEVIIQNVPNTLKIGEFYSVKITAALEYDLVGEVVI
ncbi:MAG: 30S ribosomal protein S12 methylthiotransferase RimO [Bacteroidales bacterium]